MSCGNGKDESFIYLMKLIILERYTKSEPEIMEVEVLFIDQGYKCNNEDGQAQNNVLWEMHFIAYAKFIEPSFCIWMLLNKKSVKLNHRMVES